jgi:hypothetical protein
MAPATEKKEEIVYKADPFAFLFRELDLMHNEVREVKGELVTINKRIDSMNDSIHKRFDSMGDGINKRIDDLYKFSITMNDSIHKRFDRLYIVVILNLIGIVAFLIKEFFF